ncbi:phage tail protein [Sulfurovum mangrovi]|uniref:phage tail protein n=1 Tax=Sulfurovum mangrovi TaxID=2893889 RepID=UPI001E641E6A|nr:phage tail protein [Sulfurovum mangrovi]UFH59987.1 phage tail protein [Sulfurovum mangrovi]
MSKQDIRTYEVPLTLASLSYPLESVIEDRVIIDMVVINDGCLSLLIEEEDGRFHLYFPHLDPEEQWRELKVAEAQALMARIGEKDREVEMPPIDDSIDVVTFGIDCNENLWVLGADHTLYHFSNPHRYIDESETSETFQSGNDLTVWTHLKIEGEIPKVHYDTSKGSELLVEITDGTKTESYRDATNIYLYGFKGKSLHCRMILRSDEDTHTLAPILFSVKAVYDKKSYAEYLPAYYREERETLYQPVDPEILYRFLAIFQEIMETFEEKIEDTHEMLLPALCDSNYLEWLSSLLGIARDHRWPEEKWRRFLQEAPTLFRGLGTESSMQRAIELYCDEKPTIERIGTFEFCVKLSGDKTKNSRDVEVIESIIWAFKPAHTVGRLYRDHTLNEDQSLIVGESVLPFNTKIE